MSSNAQASASVNGGGALILFGILLILKVNPGGHLDSPVEGWSWWIITAPLWGGLALILLILVIVIVIATIGEAVKRHNTKRRWEKRNRR